MMWKMFIQRFFGINKKDKQKALQTRQKLAMLYAFLGWNCFGVVFYTLVQEKMPSDTEGRRSSYRLLTGVPNSMHVYEVKGLTLTKDFDITYNTKEKEAAKIEEATAKEDEH